MQWVSPMRNTWLIIKREYLERVRTRSFIVLTLLLPAIMAGAFIVPMKLATMKSGKQTPHLVVVTSSQQFGDLVRKQLMADDSSDDEDEDNAAKSTADHAEKNSTKYVIDVDSNPSDAERIALRNRITSHEIDGYIWLADDAAVQRTATYSGRNAADFMDKSGLSRALTRAMVEQQLAGRGVSSQQADELFKPVKLEMVRMENGLESKSSGGMFFLIFGMVMLLYMAVLFYGVSVMRSVLEEKNTRILEVLLSSTSSTELMTGKLLGVGAVGLTQMIIWMIMAGTLALPSLAMYPSLSEIHISPFTLAAFVVYFVLGYLLYSAIYAGIGAIITTEQEGQQIQIIVVLPLLVSVFMMGPVLRTPDSPIAVWTSMIPFLSPLLMYARIAVQSPPVWQIALSLILLIATIAGILLLCARIYRVGMLMYGKRPTLPEIVKWLKYAKT
jgi:ABC-2 type transport system permease protein